MYNRVDIPEVALLEPCVFADARGHFFESFSQKRFEQEVCRIVFVQDNESKSSFGVVRGLHFQKPPFAQSKLVRAVYGRILDVAVDIRRGSPTFGKYVAAELSGENHKQLFVPRGFAHGFVVLSEEAVVQYKCDDYYDPASEAGIAWDDPDINIEWLIRPEQAVLSDKDRVLPQLKDAAWLFDYNDKLY